MGLEGPRCKQYRYLHGTNGVVVPPPVRHPNPVEVKRLTVDPGFRREGPGTQNVPEVLLLNPA